MCEHDKLSLLHPAGVNKSRGALAELNSRAKREGEKKRAAEELLRICGASHIKCVPSRAAVKGGEHFQSGWRNFSASKKRRRRQTKQTVICVKPTGVSQRLALNVSATPREMKLSDADSRRCQEDGATGGRRQEKHQIRTNSPVKNSKAESPERKAAKLRDYIERH